MFLTDLRRRYVLSVDELAAALHLTVDTLVELETGCAYALPFGKAAELCTELHRRFPVEFPTYKAAQKMFQRHCNAQLKALNAVKLKPL